MSKRAGGGGGGGGAARISVPDGSLRTIKVIREITGKQHTDEDIYTVLRDCNMDPNETAQRLLYIDTFHEVKSKRDRRKETAGIKSRWTRGSRGNYSATHIYPDAFGRRNATSRRDNAVSYSSEKGSSASLQAMQGRNDMVSIPLTKDSTIKANGPSTLPNGSSRHSPPLGGDVIAEDTPPINVKKPESLIPLSAAAPSASNRTFSSVVRDTISAPSMALQAGVEGTLSCKVGSLVKVAEKKHIQPNGHASHLLGSELSKNEKETTRKNSEDRQNDSRKSEAVTKDHVSGTLQISSLSMHDDVLCISSSSTDSPPMEESVSQAMVSPEYAEAVASSQSQPKPSMLNGYVTFPDHLKVPEALKSRLIFGNFDTTPVSGRNHCDGSSYDTSSANAIQISNGIDEAAQESSSSNEIPSTITQVDHSDKSDSSQHVSELVSQTDTIVFPSADPNMDQSKGKEEVLLDPKGHQNNVEVAPDHDSSIISVQGDSAQYVGNKPQAPIDTHLLSRSNENTISSPNTSLSPSVLNSAAPSQPVFFMPPYAPNYLQYGHYFNPYFVPMHLVSHGGLPQQQAGSPGAKLSLPLSKTINGSPRNPTPILPFYGSLGSPVTGFNPGLAVMSGSSAGDEDLSASQLKEHPVESQREVSTWVPPHGQDITSLQLNQLYHLYPPGQQLFFPPARAGHGPNPGIYQAVQSVAAAPVNPPVQQAHVMSASKETIATPSGAQLQTQLAQ